MSDEPKKPDEDNEHTEFTPPPEDDSLDTVERDFNREKQIKHIKETLWQNKRVRISMIAMGGLAMMSYIAWVVLK